MAGDEELRTVDGRVAGRRGQQTRRRLLETLVGMLADRSYRDLTVVEIAREADVSPATFYQYFPDVDAAIGVLAEYMADDGSRRLRALVAGAGWDGPTGWDEAKALAAGFLDLWDGYRPILRVVDLLSAEGDLRFRAWRTELLSAPTAALAAALADRRASGQLPGWVDPTATAGVLTAMLAHTAAHQPGLEGWGAATDELVLSLARILYWAVTNTEPPVR